MLYLTGAPAAGKSTLSAALAEQLPELAVFEYGARLTEYLASSQQSPLSQDEVRRRSSGVASSDDIAAVDQQLQAFVAEQRACRPVLIDSHAVTKEPYGFRITPYSIDGIRQLAPTLVAMLYTNPEVAVQRILTNPGGRPNVSPFEASFHTSLQAAVAVSYSTALGVPAYLLDAAAAVPELAKQIKGLLARPPRAQARPSGGLT